MSKNLIIIGAGPGLSRRIAEKFGKEGFTVGLVSRNSEKLEHAVASLKNMGITAFYATADANDKMQIAKALETLREKMGKVDTLVYNAAILKRKNIMEETTEVLLDDMKVSVINALYAVQTVYEDLKKNQGAVLLTGGGLAINPNPELGSVCLGKAALRNLAFQLNDTLKNEHIYAGIVTICAPIKEDSATHSPKILADIFWQLQENRSEAEIKH